MAAISVITLLTLPGTALAAPPSNDNFADAFVIGALPFSDSVDISQATIEEPNEPQACFFMERTIWYSFTPMANTAVRVDTEGSSFSTNLNVYQAAGIGLGGLSFLTCASFGNPVSFIAQAEITYYIQGGGVFGSSGILNINLQEIPPPPNDNFANPTAIPGLPFSDSIDASAATVEEPDEPTPSCIARSDLSGTIWYAFTPADGGSISAYLNAPFSTVIAAYTGSSLNNLSQIGCRAFGGRVTFVAEAGATYYFQAGGLFGGRGQLQFNLETTPPPVAQFGLSPFDPSVFDTVQFFDFSFDPGDVGIQSHEWNFGDSATATGCCPTHRYAADGDYTIHLAVTTLDGRTASTSQVVQVRTHDVTIVKLAAPKTASAGQTRSIEISLRNSRYPETVEVQLFKSTPQGYQFVGSLIQTVPVRPSNRTTRFSILYTFTSEDAAIGKVTFRTVANLLNARDALPADNEAISPPTRVTR